MRPYPKVKRYNPVGRIVRAYRLQAGQDGQPLSYQDFAADLNQPLKILGRTISPETVQGWERGKFPPTNLELHALILSARPMTLPWLLAADLKAARYPGVYPPAGEIGKRILLLDR